MKIRYALVSGALALGLAACGNDGTPAGNSNAERTEVEHYQPGGTYDAEDYNGPAQLVTGHDHENAVTSTAAPTKKCVRYRTVNNQRRCAEYKNEPGKVTVKDDEDWYVALADTTRVDVTREQQESHPVGSIWP